jgi:hypothetical protein
MNTESTSAEVYRPRNDSFLRRVYICEALNETHRNQKTIR